MPDDSDELAPGNGRSEVVERPHEPEEEQPSGSAPETAESQADEESAPGEAVIEAVEQALGCRVIVYHSATTAMEKWDLRPLYGLLEALGRQDRAALVIQSPGGSADAAHDLSSLLHDYIGDLHIYVVAYAASAATLLGLTADTLWMGPGSELSPVDPQVPIDPRMLVPSSKAAEDLPTPSEPAYVPAHVIRDFLEMTGVMDAQDGYPRQKVHPERLEGLFEPLNPWILGWYERADKVSRRYARDGLLNHLLKGTGNGESATPADRADKIIHVLLDQYASHEAGIQRGEARRIGLPVSDIPAEVWGKLEALRDWYDDVLNRQNVGRILETTDGVHVVPARPERECANCHERHEVDKGFHYCPSCGSPFNIQCGHCGQALRSGWRYCPSCATPVPDARISTSA